MGDKRLIRFICQEAEPQGYIVLAEEFVELQGMFPAPILDWVAIEGTAKHVVTFSEAEQWIRELKNRELLKRGT